MASGCILRRLTENGQGDLLVTFPLGPFKMPVTFLIHTGAQMSARWVDVASCYGIVADKKQIWVTDVFGNSKPQPTARVRCWLPRDTSPVEVTMILGSLPTNILGMDLLKERPWVDSNGREWKFRFPAASVRLLQSAPALPPSKTVNVKPYVLPLGAREGITPV